ncbi:hypothetical protein [Priestia megaterium]|uniref:hypothetical protein n=1 Tax=Priestia megaterium TaxID=1404 RepID=UPI00263BB975|nr:hypothetical protein [Priestia megaterium]MDN4866241.1 hypothetical protein [Priestia megaterium]
MLEFWKEVFTDKGVLGSIIGGLLGGFFTYLAVILTFRNQNKSEYPQKLVILAELLSEVEEVQAKLDKYFESLRKEDNSVAFVIRELNTRNWDRSFLKKAVLVDYQTYKYVSQGSVYRYPDSIRLSKDAEDVKKADLYKRQLHVLHLGVESRIRYYTKKIA